MICSPVIHPIDVTQKSGPPEIAVAFIVTVQRFRGIFGIQAIDDGRRSSLGLFSSLPFQDNGTRFQSLLFRRHGPRRVDSPNLQLRRRRF